MTKNELTRLLGIDKLMKKNEKSKLFNTMLDILCNFLIIQKEVTGGVDFTMQPTLTIQKPAISKNSYDEGIDVEDISPNIVKP
jgi:hypothetical protein